MTAPNFDEIAAAALEELSDHQVAFDLMLRASGGDKDVAAKILAHPNGNPSASAITAHRAALVAEASAAALEAWKQSPEGRRDAAARAVEAKEARQNLVKAGAELLISEGAATDDELETLTPEEILDWSGLEPSPESIRRRQEAV